MSTRNIKIELELPEFEKELNISVTLRKDGEVIEATTTTSSSSKGVMENSAWKQEPAEEKIIKSAPKTTSKKKSGNLMDLNI